MNVLVAVAHPDDEVLGVGGTIARHAAEGDEVVVVIATVARQGLITADLARASAEKLGVPARGLRLLGRPYMRLRDDQIGLNDAVSEVVAAVRPSTVYTHWHGDLNRDHGAIAEAVAVACRPVGESFPSRVLAFDTPSSTEWCLGGSFCPSVFVDIAATLDRKLAALSCYREEMRDPPHPRSVEMVRARAAYWGQVAGVPLAEAFALVREVVR